MWFIDGDTCISFDASEVFFKRCDDGFFRWEIGALGFFSWSYKSFKRAVSSILLWWWVEETSFNFLPNGFVWYYLWYLAALASLRCWCGTSITPVPLSSSSMITSCGGSMLIPKYWAAAACELSVNELLIPCGNTCFLFNLYYWFCFSKSILTSSTTISWIASSDYPAAAADAD